MNTLDLLFYKQKINFENLPGIFSFILKFINQEYFTSKDFLLKSS